MASDLSKIIQDGICTTLTSLLAKDAKLVTTNKAHIKDFENTALLKVDTEFAFDSTTTKISFMIPAITSSIIFNTMMGSTEFEKATTIDDDTSDAIGEFVSNLSGGLVTSINAASFEDLGTVKFNIPHKEILDGDTIENTDSIFKFTIDLEETELLLFLEFEEDFVQYNQEISNSPETEYPEDTPKETDEELEVGEEEKIDSENEEKTELENEGPLEKETLDENIEEVTDPKTKKLKLLIMIVGGLLAATIITVLIMYFMGVFDPEPVVEVKAESNVTKETEDQVSIVKYNTLKKVDFKVSDINVKRLNARLEELTKYEILNEKELEEQELAEKNRLYELDKEKLLIEFAKKNKEEPIFTKLEEDKIIVVDKKTKFMNETYAVDQDDINVTNNIQATKKDSLEISTNPEEETINIPTKKEVVQQTTQIVPEAKTTEEIPQEVVETKDEEKVEDEQFFVIVNSLKYKLFKDLVVESGTKQARISICNDENGKTIIFIGPFEDEIMQLKMDTLIKERNSNITTTIANITTKEFDARCDF